MKSVPSPRRHDGHGVVTDGVELITALEALVIEGWKAIGKGKPIRAIAHHRDWRGWALPR